MIQVGKTIDGIVECTLCHGKRKKRYGHFGWFTYHVIAKHLPLKDNGDGVPCLQMRRFFLDDDNVYMYTNEEISDHYRGKLKIRGVEVGSYRGVNP